MGLMAEDYSLQRSRKPSHIGLNLKDRDNLLDLLEKVYRRLESLLKYLKSTYLS